jgi:hypothetical protein
MITLNPIPGIYIAESDDNSDPIPGILYLLKVTITLNPIPGIFSIVL